MIYTIKNAINNISVQKITYAVLGSMLIVSAVAMVSTSHIAQAATPTIDIVITDADNNSNDTDDRTTKTRQKTVTATDSNNNSDTFWKYKWLAVNADCDATQMSTNTRTGNQVVISSERYNGQHICFQATNDGNVSFRSTLGISGIDRTKPDAPTNIEMAPENDTGVSNTDGITSETNVVITGCAETFSTVELLVDGQSFTPRKIEIAAGNNTACTAANTSGFEFTVSLAERQKAYTISAKTTDEAGNESSVSRQNKDIIIDTTAPTVSFTHRLAGGILGENADDNHITYLNAGDTITVEMTFVEANGISEEPNNQPVIQFYNTNNEVILRGEQSQDNSKNNVRTITYTVSSSDSIMVGNNDLGYNIVNENSIIDKAGNELTAQNTQTIANTVIDTTKPRIVNMAFSTSNENPAWAIDADEITTTITFDKAISEKAGNMGIFYRLGNTGAGQQFSLTNGRSVNSGQCQETSTPHVYECKYTVAQGDAGEFQVAVKTFTDYAGNAGDARDFEGSIVVDTTVTTPSAITLKRGIKDRDSEIAPTFVVTAGEGQGTITLYEDGFCSAEIGDGQIDDSRSPFTTEVTVNNYADDGSEDGVKTIYAVHEDAAGNVSDCSTAHGSYTLDTSPPLIESSATGYYSDEGTTTEIQIVDGKGKMPAGDSIFTKVVFDEEVRYKPGSVTPLPEIKYTIGDNEYTYRMVSYASSLAPGRCKPTKTGNISDTFICQYRVNAGDAGAFTLVVDTQTEDLLRHTLEETYTHADSILLDNTAPAKPSTLALNTTDDTGNMTDDNITNKTIGLTIEGCAEEESTVRLYVNGTGIADATDVADDSAHGCADGDNGFSIDIALTEGVHKITAKATDTSNNTSAMSDALTITVDTTAPTAVLTDAPTGTNNANTLDVTIAGVDVTHYQYAIFRGDSCANANYSDGDTDGTTIANKITTSVPNQDGSIILCVVGRDVAGNWQAKADATTATWNRDTAAPAKPIGLTLDSSDDTGLLATDNITKKTTALTIEGCAEADSTVEILKDYTSFSTKVMDVADTSDTACTAGTKKFSADIALTDGDNTYAITAIATDQSDNISEVSDPLNIVIKSTAPSITATNLDLAADDDTETNTTDNITNKKTDLTISGTLSGAPSTGDYVQLYDGTKMLVEAKDSTFTGQNNTWSIDIDLSEEGVHIVNAKVHDAAGNEGAAASITITIDTTGPTVSVTEHVVSPTTDMTPDIKIRTDAAGVVSFGGACADTRESPTVQNVIAGVNTVTLPSLENRTYSNCTVMVKDETGNLSAGAAINEFIVDDTPPTITAAAINNAARTETKVTMNERVYAPTAPAPGDFQIEIDGVTYADLVSGVSGIAKAKESASQSFMLTHDTLPTGSIGVKYVKGVNHIFDQIGNTLETSGTSTAISATQFISIMLHADDDTGHDNTDGLTRFDGNEVTLTASLNTGTFANSDQVRIYMGGGSTPIASYTVSTIIGARYVDADGETSFDFTLPKSRFNGGTNTISGTYAKAGGTEGGKGAATTITHDITTPTITIQNPNAGMATQKEVGATDNESGATTWMYKVLTEVVQICNAATMASSSISYTEGTAITFESTGDNGNRVCFSVMDAAGNTAYLASTALSGIDGDAPTIDAITTTSADGRTARVTLSERVYAAVAPALSDFKVVVSGSEYPIAGITGLATGAGNAKNTLIITLPALASNARMTLKYTAGANKITDIVGNQLANFDKQEITNMKLISLDLHASDDTGISAIDNITQFVGNTVTITATLNEGTFSNGDMVRLFTGNSSSPIRTYTISNTLTGSNYKNATGDTSVTIDLPIGSFYRGLNNLSATYQQSGGTESARGNTLAITYDIAEPRIIVQNPSSAKEQQKTVSARDLDSAATAWQYKQIAGTVVCNAAAMTGSTTYTEGATTIVLNKESDNGTKICFSVVDLAGNAAYHASDRISNIDTTAPTISGVSITTTSRTTTKVSFNEPVYARANISPNSFRITSGQIQYFVTGVTGLANSNSTAEASLTLTHVPIDEAAVVQLQYTKGDVDITDVAGNALKSFNESIANTSFVTLALNTADDTGESATDAITRFDGDEVSFTLTLTSGTFTDGDQIHIYKKEDTTPIRRIIIASAGGNTVNAGGTTSFTTTISKQVFAEGEMTIYATYTPVGQIAPTSGIDFAFTYDNTAPRIFVDNFYIIGSIIETKKKVTADDYDTSATTWVYEIIDEDTTCNASAISASATAYTEGSDLDITSNDANGKKVCFASTDMAGNTGYRSSRVITGIDSAAPTVETAVIENYERTRTVLTFDEKVYASTGFSASEFSIEIGDTGYNHRVSAIENLPTTANRARETLVLIHPAISDEIESRITYTPGDETIRDIAGNTLEKFSTVIENTSFVTLDLADEDDTGLSSEDNYTRLEGSAATLSVALTNNAVFSNSDVVTIYKGSDRTIVKRVTVSTFPAQDAVNAHGDNSFNVEIPDSVFDKNATTALSAGYAPFGNTALNKISSALQVTVDTNDPIITITEASAGLSAQKTVRATSRDTTEMEWQYAQIQSGVVCDADALQTSEEYTKDTVISLNSEAYNGTKICFSAADLAGNTAYKSSEVIDGIDTEAPRVSSIAVTGEDEITVTMSEPVYAVRNPNPDDFVVFINGSPSTTDTISDIPTNTRRADNKFIIIVADTIRADDTVSLSYIGSSRSNTNELIRDVIGNTLATFDKMAATLPSVLTITLDPAYDTGASATDKITRFSDNNKVNLVVTLNEGTFKDGDQVRVYQNGGNRAVATTTIGIRGNEVNARGETSLTVTVDKQKFTEGEVQLHATYRPRGEVEGLPSAQLSITYDTTAPKIAITNPDKSVARSKDVSATDGEAKEVTHWMYKKIAGDSACDAAEMSNGTETYTEGSKITLNEESDNGTKVCFSVADTAGNTAYRASGVLEGIDTMGSKITVTNPNNTPAQKKTVKAVDDDDTEADWKFKQISSEATCDAEEMSTGTQSYAEGRNLSFGKESSNGTKVCFSVTDAIGNISYGVSTVLTGIDETPPQIMVTNPTNDPEQEKVVSATDTDTKETVWMYKQISGRVTCDAGQMGNDAKAYLEGDEITLSSEDDNGTKICFSATDAVGNNAYTASSIIDGIDATAPTIAITNPKSGSAQEKTIQAADTDTTETIWAHKQITSSAKCDEAQMISGTQPYTEGTELTFNKEDDNGTKICFSATDLAGNTAYERSTTLKDIDTTVPVITINNPDVSIVSSSKKVSATDDEEESQWTYRQISEDAVCDTTVTPTTKVYTEGTDIIFDKESDNGTKICFTATDAVGGVAAQASIVLMNIKEDALTISATVSEWTDFDRQGDSTVPQAQAKAVVGVDASDAPSTWFYKQIAGDAVCNAAVRGTEGVVSYAEGEPVVLRKETDNGTKICFISVDSNGKVTATASEVITGIDTTMPTIVITNPDAKPAQEKIVVATDRDSKETSWEYKQIAADAACNSDTFTSVTETYIENTPLTFTEEGDNDTKVCFKVTDSADNTAYAASEILTGIDTTAPTITSAKLLDVSRTQTRITISEYVSANGAVSPSDFKIEIEDVLYPATKIARFERSMDTEGTTFVITHPSIAPGAAATIAYTEGNVSIVDAVGNALEDISGQPLLDKAFVALSLDASDDTGESATDGITNFAGYEVTLIATISDGSFSNGDVVRLYKKGTARAIERILISSGLVNATSAHGESAFEIVIPRSTFTANEETTLYTVYTPADGSNGSGQRGFEFTVSYRTEMPQVTVSTTSVSAATTTVRATDGHADGETAWHYKQIKDDEECAAEALSQGASAYTEGTEITFRDESTNDTKACFSSADIAGNTTYAASDEIDIDLTAPSITVEPLTGTPEGAKIVRANDNDDEKTTWKYRVLKAEEVCDAKALSRPTRPYKEGSGLKFSNERANGHKVCFSSTDASGNILFAESTIIRGIDATAPQITVTMDGDEEKTVRAKDTDTSGRTAWKYRVIKANESCTKEAIAESSRPYREGSGLVFRNSRANGYKVCFAATDSAGNTSYRTSGTMQGIGKTSISAPSNTLPSSSALQDANRPTNTASPLAPLTNPLYPITTTP